MNQRALAQVTLYGPPNAAVAALTTGTGTDIGAGYASVGRREMKALMNANFGANTTALDVKLQENTTSGSTGFTDISGAAFTQMTTSGVATPIHFSTSKRYLRAIITPAGTTAAVIAHVSVLVEDRYTP